MTSEIHKQIIASIDAPRREEIQRLHDLITSVVPDWEQWETKGIMAFGRYSYYGSSKKCSGEWFFIGLNANKSSIAVYITLSENGVMLPESAKGKLGTNDIGKSCIRTKSVDKLNLEELTKLFQHAKKIVEAGGTGPGGQ